MAAGSHRTVHTLWFFFPLRSIMTHRKPKTNLRSQTTSYLGCIWHENACQIRIGKHAMLYLSYEHDNHVLKFYSRGVFSEDNEYTDYQMLLKFISKYLKKDGVLYLEWCDKQTGKYSYYDISKILNMAQNTTIDVHHFGDAVSVLMNDEENDSNNNNNNNNRKCENASADQLMTFDAEFDESVGNIDAKLNKHDILIYSPMRAMVGKYTNMGDFNNGHTLYLGPRPTADYLQECQILLILNCCLSANDARVMHATNNPQNMTEKCFDICRWKSQMKYEYDRRYDFDADGNSVSLEAILQLHANNPSGNDDIVTVNRILYLDKMVDYVYNHLKFGNVLIHCIAGAHRSAFVVGCYLLKYGRQSYCSTSDENDEIEQEMNKFDIHSETAVEDIYVFMKRKRKVVQELGYDKFMKQYQTFLLERENEEHTGNVTARD